MRGNDGFAAAGDDGSGVGAIEQPAEVGGGGTRSGADRHQVQRPPGHGQVPEGGPSPSGLEAAGHREQGVADGFGLEPTAVHPPEQAILRVRGGPLGIAAGTLLVGRRQHDEPVHLLDGPARRDEARGQEIQQFGVRGPVASRAEVVGGADQSLAEVVLPDPVDHHPRRQGMVGRVNQSASCRRPLPSVIPAGCPPVRTRGKPRGTVLPGLLWFPRRKT